MSDEMREEVPVTITLKSLLQLFASARNDKLKAASAETAKKLLGEDAYSILFDHFEEGSSIVRIKACVHVNQKAAYSQSYTQYTCFFEHYYCPAEKTADGLGRLSASQQEQAGELRSFIRNAWKERLPLSSKKQNDIDLFLTDASLLQTCSDSVRDLHQILKDYRSAVSVDDQAEFFTMLTLLSITRQHWDQLPLPLIVPGSVKTKDTLQETPPFQLTYQKAAAAFEQADYSAARDLLQNLEQERLQPSLSTTEDLYLFNSKVALLRIKACQKLLHGEQDSSQADELKRDISDSLTSASEKWHNQTAVLAAAREYYYELQPTPIFQRNWEKCKALCLDLIRRYPEAPECGEAYWLLYQMEDDETKKEDFLLKSARYSYEKAVVLCKEKNAVSLTANLEASADFSKGICFFNADNVYASFITRTKPDTWKKYPYPFTGSSLPYEPFDFSGIPSRANCRFFLIHDDFEKNLRELLHILQSIKAFPEKASRITFEFFIRGEEDKISPFIDTALARLEDRIIPVHILDDAKRSARVLAEHPLFYPLRHLSPDAPATLKFVIVGDSDLCAWLFRESFWMLTFRNPAVTAEIILASPDPEQFMKKVNCQYPNLEKSFSQKITTLKIGYDDSLVSLTSALDTRELLSSPDSYAYFAVDTGSDINNLAVSVKLREYCVRKRLKNTETGFQTDPPVIAFHCQDPDLANLSLNTVVLNENSGNHWFNNYSLIPFGRLDRLYHWDTLTNDILERLSLNVHLQYYLQEDNDEKKHPATLKEECLDGLKDYYRKTYNRDSSMAVAMSLPYRLFQGAVNGKRILPSVPLNISDPATFFSEKARRRYADWTQKLQWETLPYEETILQKHQNDYKSWADTITQLDVHSEVYQMADWEQKRWARFMISRNWNTASKNMLLAFFEHGNTRQQLYIGALHSCLVPYEKLETTDIFWKNLSGTSKNFEMPNITAIRRTERLLNLYWYEKARNYFSKTLTVEERA